MEWQRMIYQGKDLGDLYLISSRGDIMGVKTRHIRKQKALNKGYMYCVISLGCREHKVCVRVHRAVAETFIPNPDNKPEVNHKDGDKSNNDVTNLEWVYPKENTCHAFATGLRAPLNGSKNGMTKLTSEDVAWAKSVFIPRHREFGLRGLARKLGVDHSTLSSAIRGTTWKTVTA